MLIIKFISINLLFIASVFLLLPSSPWLLVINTLATIFLAAKLLQRENQQQQKILQAIFDGLQNLQDGDFSISLTESLQQKNNAKQHQLITLFNQVTDKLRAEKQSLYQRELLLDKVVNASDLVTVLVNHRNTIIFANRAAQHFFGSSVLLGQQWSELLEQNMPELLQHHDKNNAIIQLLLKETISEVGHTVTANHDEKTEQSWHLARHLLKLHGSNHQLILLKPLTKELHQQELQTWKKVIKVINHELNNSIAPISSMCHSGLILAERLNEPKLNRVFKTISGRINKLSEFIKSYSQLARLSIPQKTFFDIIKTVEQLKSLYQLELIATETVISLNADESQIDQLLINLLKNAREFSPSHATQIILTIQGKSLNIVVRDFGSGMSVDIMKKAFLPYYSTKVEGSGIGLSICREVVDAHHGQIALNNHPEGGLQVTVSLPLV
jgi:nitrogen fixation/metabolism regulation signal transduction histidine kinase